MSSEVTIELEEVPPQEREVDTSFQHFGHLCELPPEERILEKYIPGNTRAVKFRRAAKRFIMVDAKSMRCRLYMRSQAAIKREYQRHAMTSGLFIHPFSKFRIWWESIYCVYMMLMTCLIPVNIFLVTMFYEHRVDFAYMLLAGDLMGLVDVGLHFITGRAKGGEVITDRRQIALDYVKRSFVPDLLCTIPYFALFKIVNGMWRKDQYKLNELQATFRWLQYVRILGILRFFYVTQYMTNAIQTFQVSYELAYLWILMLRFFMIFHWLSMMQVAFWLTDKSWSHAARISSRDVSERYITCVHRALCLMTQLGAKDETRSGTLDCYFSWILMLTGRVMLIIAISYMVQITKGTRSSVTKYETMISELRVYILRKRLPPRTKRRMIRFYEYKFRRKYFQEVEIMNTAGEQLQDDIRKHNCHWLLERVEFFKTMPLGLLMMITKKMQVQIFLVNDVIVRVGTVSDSMYFITCGTVAIYTKNCEEVGHLDDGNFFGEMSMINRDQFYYGCSIVAVSDCELYKLSRSDFNQLILPYPDLVETLEKSARLRMEQLHHIEYGVREARSSQRIFSADW